MVQSTLAIITQLLVVQNWVFCVGYPLSGVSEGHSLQSFYISSPQ